MKMLQRGFVLWLDTMERFLRGWFARPSLPQNVANPDLFLLQPDLLAPVAPVAESREDAAGEEKGGRHRPGPGRLAWSDLKARVLVENLNENLGQFGIRAEINDAARA